MNVIVITLSVLGALVLLGSVLLEMHRRSVHTRMFQVPGGLRFEAQNFSMQVQRKEQEVRVTCVRGLLTSPAAAATPEVAQAAGAECTFAALGFAVEVRDRAQHNAAAAKPIGTGYYDLVLRGADGTQLIIENVNSTVAASFNRFFQQVRHWIDKLEQRVERERVARLRGEEESAQAKQDADLLAQLVAHQVPNQALTPADLEVMAAAQIAQWRKAAGFTGLHCLHQTDPQGQVLWFMDAAADGRITLHADKRTLHTTLRGASIASSNGELEVGVRDAYWTESDADLRMFRLMKGRNADERRAWKERLEIIRKSMPAEEPR